MKRLRKSIETMGLMKPMGLIGLMSLVGLAGLVGCSSEDDEVVASDGPVLEVTTCMAGREERTLTRAWTIPTGYEAYEDGAQPIGIAFTQNGNAPLIGSIFKGGDKWRTSFEDIPAGGYYLYGYIPHQSGINFSITDLDGANAAFSAGAIMTLEKVPTVMPHDLCVAIGAKDGTDKEHDNGLRMGDFAFTAKAINKANPTEGTNYVFLLFDHLYASLRIRMKVNGEYAALRTIKLRSLQMSTLNESGTSTLTKENTIRIKLGVTDGSTSPIQDIEFTRTGDVIESGLTFWSSGSGTALTTGYQAFNGFFTPQDIHTLVLTSTYDVYDRKGNLIRQGCKATNKIKDILTGHTEARLGTRYIINMTVQPTYLYMLSEPDLDSPTVTLN